jgi:hypothetical protein
MLNNHDRLFSPAALDAFRKFREIDEKTAHQRPAGATDGGPRGFNRRFANDGVAGHRNAALNHQRLARDQTETTLDPETVAEVFEIIRESCDDKTAARIMKILHEVCPGCLGDMPGLDEADEPDDANPNPAQSYGGRGTEAFDKEFPSTTGTYPGGPRFEGAPRPGGGQIPLRPQRSGTGMVTSDSSDYLRMFPQAANLAYDANVVLPYKDGQPVRNITTRRAARQSSMAMDSVSSRDEREFERLFGTRRIGLL